MQIRLLAITLAALSDFLDGFLARKFKCTSAFGRVADPLGDKFFIGIGLIIFLQEGAIMPLEALLMLSRDGAVLAFGFFLVSIGKLKDYSIRAILCGKVTTTLQLIVFTALTLGFQVPFILFPLFGLLGLFSFYELYTSLTSTQKDSPGA